MHGTHVGSSWHGCSPPACRTKSSCVALCNIQRPNLLQVYDRHRRYDKLSNPLSARYRKRFITMIDKKDLNFPAIIRVYRTRRIQHRDPMAIRETGAGAYLSLKPGG